MKTLTTKQFINKAKNIHGDKYNYLKTNYIKSLEPVEIICPIHGSFWQKPNIHLSGCGCPGCAKRLPNTSADEFIKKANLIHSGKYNYTNVVYKNRTTKIEIICPIHGSFFQTPNNHLNGRGCPGCAKQKMGRRSLFEDVAQRANIVHCHKYDYSKSKYINGRTDIEIICPVHGSFWQKPEYHLAGNGCPKCKSSRLEMDVRRVLQSLNIDFEEQVKFDWLTYKKQQTLDFYIPSLKLGIECQGQQHFKPVKIFGGDAGFDMIIKRDQNKNQLCEKHGIQMIYINFSDKNIDEIIKQHIRGYLGY